MGSIQIPETASTAGSRSGTPGITGQHRMDSMQTFETAPTAGSRSGIPGIIDQPPVGSTSGHMCTGDPPTLSGENGFGAAGSRSRRVSLMPAGEFRGMGGNRPVGARGHGRGSLLPLLTYGHQRGRCVLAFTYGAQSATELMCVQWERCGERM